MLDVLGCLLEDGSGDWVINNLGKPWRENVLRWWATRCQLEGLTTQLTEERVLPGVKSVIVRVSGVRVQLNCYEGV